MAEGNRDPGNGKYDVGQSEQIKRRHVIAAAFIIPVWFALYGLAGRNKAPYLEVPHLEVLDVDLVMEQNRGLKGTESQAVFCAYILVVINEFAISTRAFDGFGKSEHG
jgi:hypothetical protein